jgi:hypothetical protein
MPSNAVPREASTAEAISASSPALKWRIQSSRPASSRPYHTALPATGS